MDESIEGTPAGLGIFTIVLLVLLSVLVGAVTYSLLTVRDIHLRENPELMDRAYIESALSCLGEPVSEEGFTDAALARCFTNTPEADALELTWGAITIHTPNWVGGGDRGYRVIIDSSQGPAEITAVIHHEAS